jgi:hypothetical protein
MNKIQHFGPLWNIIKLHRSRIVDDGHTNSKLIQHSSCHLPIDEEIPNPVDHNAIDGIENNRLTALTSQPLS